MGIKNQLNEIDKLVLEIRSLDLDALDKHQKIRLQALSSDLAAVSSGINGVAQQALTVDEKSIMEDVQTLWVEYAKRRGRNPDAQVAYDEWLNGFEADGIKLGDTLRDAHKFLKQQV